MPWLITNLIAALLLPPLNTLLIALTGLLIWRKYPRTARIMLSTAFILLWIFSTPIVADSLIQAIEKSNTALNTRLATADAIVVLGGGSYFAAPEYAGDTVNSASLQRLRYAAKLFRELKKPILLTGGTPTGNAISEAQQMKQVMEQEYNIPVQWIEEKSDNTFESARFSYRILKSSGISRIFLVTHAWHMPRSIQAFQAAGFEVAPAPTAFTTRYQTNLLSFAPNAKALSDSQISLHEMIGMLWYRLKS